MSIELENAMSEPNPFLTPKETRSVTLTLRVTPTEHDAMLSVTGDKSRGEVVELIREGIGLAIEHRRAAAKKGRKS